MGLPTTLRKLFPLGLLLLGLAACETDPRDLAKLQQSLQPDIEIAEGVEILYSDSAQLKVIVRAPIMENILDSKDPRQRFPNGLQVIFLDELGDTSSVLTAKAGVYRETKQEVLVRDSVVWQSREAQKLETDELSWSESSKRIFTDRFVVITQPDYIIYGYGLDADESFSNATIRQVTGKVPITRPQ